MPELRQSALRPELRLALAEITAGSVRFDEPLDALTRWRIGGPAAAYVVAHTSGEVAAVLSLMRDRTEPLIIIGETSNLLFDSAGFSGVVLRLGGEMRDFTISGTTITAGAATSVPDLASAAGAAGLTGVEHVVGIPGTLGGLIAMNGGTQRRGIGENVTTVSIVDSAGRERTIEGRDAGFAYRRSIFQDDDSVIVGATLQLERGDRELIENEMASIRAERARKFPSDEPNCGSTFLSDPKMYAVVGPPGRAIEEAGLKGLRHGGAVVSTQHANFINNIGGATSDDVLWLIETVRTTVERKTGFDMPCEVRHVGVDGRVRPAHISAAERWAEDKREESN